MFFWMQINRVHVSRQLFVNGKRVAPTMKTASGVKRLQEEKAYEAWLNQLFTLVKTRYLYQP